MLLEIAPPQFIANLIRAGETRTTAEVLWKKWVRGIPDSLLSVETSTSTKSGVPSRWVEERAYARRTAMIGV